jgi:hypothetical protein
MRKKTKRNHGSTPPLLSSDSMRNFHKFQKACASELGSNGPIQAMYTREFAYLDAQIIELREVKYSTLRRARESALLQILRQLVETYGDVVPDLDDPPELLPARYFNDEKEREQILHILASFGIDESAIDAQALKNEMHVLEAIEKQLASLEARRDKALACLAAYRESFVNRVDQPVAAESKEPAPPQINKTQPNAQEEGDGQRE